MKKRLSRLFCAFLMCVTVLSLLPLRAEAAGASFSGASSLRAGNSVTVTFAVSGSNILAIDANLRYDSDSLELLGTKQLIGGSWDMQQNGSKFILYDTKQTSPINSSKNVFSVTFRVKSDVSVGSTVSASVSGTASDGSSESSISGSWSATIKAPLSGDAKLTDLTCSNADLNFTGASEYWITVPYSVSSLDLDWTRSHSGADVSVSGNKLSVGSNTVTITVTAENGNTKRYYIYAKRQQDPNYVPSTDARLKTLTVSEGSLSPAFDPDIHEYVVYLPYEIDRLELSGTLLDSKAIGVRQVGSSNLPSDKSSTVLLMRCTAEDDKTILDYTIHVIRMPAFNGELPEIIAPEEKQPEPVTPVAPEPEPEPTLELPLLVTLPYVGEVEIWWVAGAALLVLLLLVWLLAWAIGRRGGRRKALRQLAKKAAAEAEQPAAQEPAVPAAAPAVAEKEEEAPAAEEKVAAEAPAEEEKPAEAAPAEEKAAEEAPVKEAPSTAEEKAEAEEIPAAEETPSPEEAPAVEEAAAPAVIPVVTEPAEAKETPAAEIPAVVENPAMETPPVEEKPVEAAPAVEEKPAEEAPAAEEKPAEEAPAEEEKPAKHTFRSSDPLEELGGMSLDELLEDIRNM